MAYLLGTATDENDLLSQFVTWLATLGWTVNAAPVATSSGSFAQLSKAGVYVNLFACINNTSLLDDYSSGIPLSGIALYLSDGYDSGQTWRNQPGGPMALYPLRAFCYLTTKSFTHPFGRFFAFSDANDNVVLVLERRALNFASLGWGPSLIKAGGYSDGGYFFFQ